MKRNFSADQICEFYFRVLRKVALGKTIFLAFVWMYVTTILPAIISDSEWNTSYVLFVVSRFFQIYAICILFDWRDREDDKADGIRSLITYLNEKFPQHEFSIIMGSDSYQNLPRWKNYEQLLKNTAIYIYKRAGFENIPEYPNAKLNILEAPLLQISATHIRDILKEGKSIRYLVPDIVKEEIERNHYYL